MPNDQTPEERGFQEGMRYVPGGNLDAGWHRSASSWCPYTFNITVRTAFIGLLAWIVGMLAGPGNLTSAFSLPQGEMAVKLVFWALYYICVASAIALPLLSIKELNWVGQLFWIYFFFHALVLESGPNTMPQVFLFTVVGSAVSEVVLRIWAQNSDGDSLLTYRIRTIGRYLVRGALICSVLWWAGVSVYTWAYYKINGPAIQAKYEEERRQEEAAEAEKAKRESAPPVAPAKPPLEQPPSEPVVTPPPVPSLPIPMREPDAKFSFAGQPTVDSPPARSYLFNDIEFESGDGPTPESRKQVVSDLQRGIPSGRRFSRSDMWPSNVALATDIASKRLQQDAAQLAGMECRVWVLDYGLQLWGFAVFIHEARLQVECRR